VGLKFDSYLGSKIQEIIIFISFFFAAMFYVYILYSHKYDRYYIGHTSDVNKRLEVHNNPRENKYTSKYIPWELKLFFKVSESRGEAMLVERFIKKQKSREFIRKLIHENGNQEFFEDFVTNIFRKRSVG